MPSQREKSGVAESQITDKADAAPKVRRRSPPRWVWIIVAICAVLIAFAWSERMRLERGDATLLSAVLPQGIDGATTNIFTLICSFIAFAALANWFCFFSGYSKRARLVPLAAVVALAAIAAAILRIEYVNGDLVPRYRFRWLLAPDELLGQAVVTAQNGNVDLRTVTPHDYPRFLGPSGSASLEGPLLERDWNANGPKLLWRQPIGAGWSAFSVVNGFAVTMEQRGEEELTTCYETGTGKLRWAHSITARHSTTLGGTGPRSTPTIHEGKVFALGATGILRCLDGADGHPIWTVDLLKKHGLTPEEDLANVAWGRAASPLIVDDLVVVPSGGPRNGPRVSLVALDQRTGSPVWQSGTRQVGYSSPDLATIGGVRQILIVNEDTVSGHDAAGGAQLWEHPWPGTSNMDANTSQAVAIGGDRILVSKGYSGGCEVFSVSRDSSGKWTTSTRWENRQMLKTKLTNVAIHNGYAYGLSDGILECVRLADGHRQWKRGRYGHGQVLRVADVLLVTSETGEVALVDVNPQRYQELSRIEALTGQTWNNPALSGNLLLVRNGEEAACYELPLRQTP